MLALRFPGFAPFTDKSRIEKKISMEDWWIDTEKGKLQIDREREREREKPVPVQVRPPQISNKLAWERTVVSVARVWRLTV